MNERSLGIHQIILCIDTLGKNPTDSNIISDHRDILFCRSSDVGINGCSRNFVQTYLKPGWAPLHKAYLVVLFQPLNRGVCLLRLDISPVINRDRHVLVLDWIKFSILNEHVLRLETVISNFTYGLGLMRSLFLADH